MHFNSIEEVIANELFLAWYFKTDDLREKQWEHWLLQHPEYHAMAQEAAQWMKDMNIREKPLPAAQVEAAHARLGQALDKAPVIEMHSARKRWWIPAAAAVLLLVAGILYWTSQSGRQCLDSKYGTISAYRLPDGSMVTLNANSNIKLDKDWKTGGDREVWLDGEAFFKVQKTPAHDRFVVHTKTMDIIVTGTQFNAISRDEESSVLLTEGSVTVRTKEGKEMHMTPGDFVRIENNTPSKQPVDQERVLAWKQSKLDFEKTPMTEVAKIITRHYGVKVNLDKTISTKTISGIVPNDNLDVLIRALEATGDYRITRADNEINISAP